MAALASAPAAAQMAEEKEPWEKHAEDGSWRTKSNASAGASSGSGSRSSGGFHGRFWRDISRGILGGSLGLEMSSEAFWRPLRETALADDLAWLEHRNAEAGSC